MGCAAEASLFNLSRGRAGGFQARGCAPSLIDDCEIPLQCDHPRVCYLPTVSLIHLSSDQGETTQTISIVSFGFTARMFSDCVQSRLTSHLQGGGQFGLRSH
jgi:hypothetical protein